MGKSKTTEQYIKIARDTYNNYDYDYTNTKLIGMRDRVTVFCNTHNIEFSVNATQHLYKNSRCPLCKKEEDKKRTFKNSKEFAEKATQIHNGKYSYEHTVYIDLMSKVVITCPTHGEFTQLASSHVKGHGCNKCSKELVKNPKLTTEQFIGRSTSIHGDRYDYSKSIYKDASTKITIVCKEHGEFLQKPITHMSGINCPKCRGYRKTINDIQKKMNKNYTILTHSCIYTDADKLNVNCIYHGNFTTTVRKLHLGKGCNKCAVRGFKTHLPGTLYYLSIDNGTAYKIGITNKSINERFHKQDIKRMKVIKTWYYENGKDCLEEEQRILKEFKHNAYKGYILLPNGNTELFNKDVLLLDSND